MTGPGALEKVDRALPMELSVGEVVGRAMKIKDVMQHVMLRDEHYGVIPGTSKPTLYQPGAQKLLQVFMLRPEIHIEDAIREKDFISYIVRCDVVHIPTGNGIASGMGSCNSREDKYRYRLENTGRALPKDYWKHQDPALLGGPQYRPRKKAGKWLIFEQIEHDNPWDYDNTILKMATKRALMAATLNATAASDIFAMAETEDDEPAGQDTQASTSPISQTGSPDDKQPSSGPVDDDANFELVAKIRELGEAIGKKPGAIKAAIKGCKTVEDLEQLKNVWGRESTQEGE